MAYNHEYPYVDMDTYNDDWLLNKMKELIAEWAQMQQSFATLQAAFDSLKAYVDNYFANLDVQQEVNNKLDEMYQNGQLGELIGTYVKPYVRTGGQFAGKNVIWIGDSWCLPGIGNVTTAHPEQVASALKFKQLIKLAQPGIGYKGTSTTTFLSILQNQAASMQPDEIADIGAIFLDGSINDGNYTETTLVPYIEEVIKYCENVFPNAIIIGIAPIYPYDLSLIGGLRPSYAIDAVRSVFRSQMLPLIELGYMFMGRGSLFSDSMHPSQQGQDIIAYAIVNEFTGGRISHSISPATYTVSGMNVSIPFQIGYDYTFMIGGNYTEPFSLPGQNIWVLEGLCTGSALVGNAPGCVTVDNTNITIYGGTGNTTAEVHVQFAH